MNLQLLIDNYLNYCSMQKRLDSKTLKAYRIDLRQFAESNRNADINMVDSDIIEAFISTLHSKYQPKTVKRKIASLKAFFHYLEYRDIININPFNRIAIHFREPVRLPKTIPLTTVESFLAVIYEQIENAGTSYKKRNALRNAAIIELLFASGIRISELCSLYDKNVNLENGTILIYGKGSKERLLNIGNNSVLKILRAYRENYNNEINECKFFFSNQNCTPVSDQAIRRMINKYTLLASIDIHITPHMFRHTFATCLLEAGVDIRYIQEMLGHSSINITEIYTHVAIAKQKDILMSKHPRKDFNI